jgi:hypothetical protein
MRIVRSFSRIYSTKQMCHNPILIGIYKFDSGLIRIRLFKIMIKFLFEYLNFRYYSTVVNLKTL